MTPFIIAFYGIAAIGTAIAALIIAPRRGRNGQSWAFWCFLFPPIFAVLYFLKPTDAPAVRKSGKGAGEDDFLELH